LSGWASAQYRHEDPLLLNIGTKTCLTRTTSVAYSRDGDRYVIVASVGGKPRASVLQPQGEHRG
jgi:hypothetical protein